MGIAESLRTVQGRLLRLEAVVLLSAVILSVLVLYGATRRRSSDKLVLGFLGVAYTVSYVVVSYTVGLIQDGPFHDEAFVLWAAALLLIQASAYSTSAHGRRDIDQRKKLLLQHVLQTGLVLWLVVNASGRNTSYRAAIWAFWGLSVLKTSAKIADMVRASRPDPSVKVVADYMAVEHTLTDDKEADPKTMKGYKYLFHGEESMLPIGSEGGRRAQEIIAERSTDPSVVTIDEVWQWINRQHYSEAEKDKVRDFCLAFALFKLLKRRFYGYIPAEAGLQKTHKFVFSGLLYPNPTGPDPAFRVVEAELAFLYDYFYTRNIVPIGARAYVCIVVAILVLAIWATALGTFGPSYHAALDGVIRGDDANRAVTVVIVAMTVVLELSQAFVGFSSKWRYINNIYRNVRGKRNKVVKSRRLHLWWKSSIAPPEPRYWEDKIGQYVLLKRYNHRPWNVLSWLTLYLVEPRREGQKRGRKKELPGQVRRAVLVSLQECDGQLTDGRAALQKHGLLPKLQWACDLPTYTDMILVWHITTTLCHWGSPGKARRDLSDDQLVATRLSNYCAYLVAFVPEMLPDQSYTTERAFDSAVQQARELLEGCKGESTVLSKMDQLMSSTVSGANATMSILERGALLAGEIKTVLDAEDSRWKALADFWAEFIVFLAPSGDVDIHAEMLGAGGEFMTQLWVLLAHAGILERPPTQHFSSTAAGSV